MPPWSRSDGSKPIDWTNGRPPARPNAIPIVSNDENEIQPDVFSEWINEAIENEYSMYGDLPTPAWVREAIRRNNEIREEQIQQEISAEDDREYMHLIGRLRNTTRQIRNIQNGTGGGDIAALRYLQTNLRRQIAQARMNPRITRSRATAFRRYVRDQRDQR